MMPILPPKREHRRPRKRCWIGLPGQRRHDHA